ncbi:MAG: type II toxin-antitoxin system VapC family toxin [Candidatus Anammoxibacter sp.]
MKYLLDTCVISELTKPKPNIRVVEWINQTPLDSLFLSVITIGEIRKWLNKLPKSKRKEKLTVWLNTLMEEYKERLLPIDLAVSENWGVIQENAERSGIPMASIDSFIAATAHTYNLTVVTRNEKDFHQVSTINPWNL